MEKELLNVLVVDDSEDDTLLLERELKRGEWDISVFRVDSFEMMKQVLENRSWDVVLSDFMIPGFGGMEALELFKTFDLDIPFILMSGKITEEIAVVALQEGAQDFVSKQNLSRLLPAIRRGIERVKILSERKAVTEALRESETRYRLLADYAQECIFWSGIDGRYQYVSPACFRISGYTPEKFLANPDLILDIIHPDDRPKYESHLANLPENDIGEMEYRIFNSDGSVRWIAHYCNAVLDEHGVYIGRRGSNRDITERKINEINLKNEMFRRRRLMESSHDGIAIFNQQHQMTEFNTRFSQMLGYTPDEMYALHTWDFEATMDEADIRRRFADLSTINTTIETRHRRKDGTEYDAEVSIGGAIIDDEPIAFTISRDITERKEAEKNLHNSLIGTVRAISDIVEMRDPYTAGHQKRVAQLACAIANELGMQNGQIEGLHLAAEIHDVGKIQIPAEILSKPTKITEIEYQMIQTHPEAGYMILKDIEFPWPIAEMIRQHHEKLDGSGYPRGLKDDDILLEARILTVADIVEAMASHRPYRPALGIEAALKEIQKERGTKLDARVVDVCIKLFKENKFNF